MPDLLAVWRVARNTVAGTQSNKPGFLVNDDIVTPSINDPNPTITIGPISLQ